MANLAPCPDCGAPVSKRAPSWPRCGCPLKKAKKRGFLGGCATVVLVSFALAIVVGLLTSQAPITDPVAKEVDLRKSDTSKRAGDDVKGQSAYPVLVVGDQVILQNEGNSRVFVATTDSAWDEMLGARPRTLSN